MRLLHVAATAVFLAGCALVATAEDKKMPGPLDVKMKDIDGKDLDLSKFKGKVVLIVNVASFCGNTPQYKGLQDLYSKYEKEGLVVLGVPANDFGAQEPNSDIEIKKFCTDKYSVTFPMTTKVVVKGKDKTELYKILTEAVPDKSGKVTEVAWNFEKFLVGRDGKVAGRFSNKTKPDADEVTKAIKAELEKPAPPK